ncbi:MAG: cytochrome c family protein [Pseudomonadota bacterium]
MDSFELNKIFCAILATVFVTMSLSLISEALFHVDEPAVPGFEIATLEPVEDDGEEDAGPLFDPVIPLMASADIAAGESQFKKCSSCHNVEPGGANGVGPALHGVMGRDIAGVDGYGYSQALIAYGEGKQWTWEEMNGFLWKPKTYVSGTAMGFAGIRSVEDRANIIAYLNANSDNPLPLPDPASMEMSEDGAEDSDGEDTAVTE